MNDEHISKHEAVNAIKSLESSMSAKDNYAKGYDAALGRALIAVREVPPASDVQPVKHGYWKEEEPRVLKCSVCGENAPMNYLGQNCIDSSYCPWCGARMKEAQ